MAKSRIPITIEKITTDSSSRSETNKSVNFLISIKEKDNLWDKSIVCDRASLINFRDEISKLIGSISTAEILQITSDKGVIVEEHYSTDKLCEGCQYKLTKKCVECLFTLQSPLERKLFLEFSKSYIRFQSQYPLNWDGEPISIDGKTYDDPINNFRNVLTVVDFFIEKKNKVLCIYTDGHSYHERTEDQAKRDRTIDRKLQEFGFTVLRYTGKEVNEEISKIVNEVKKWIE